MSENTFVTRGLMIGLAMLALAACGGGGGGASSAGSSGGNGSGGGSTTGGACGESAKITWVRDVAQSWYLWYDELAPINVNDYTSASAYLADLTAPLAADNRDPGFSYITTVAEDEANFTSGAYIGFGFRYHIDAQDRFFFSDVFEGGPAYDAGLRRGIEVLAIDTGSGYETLAELSARNASSEELFGVSEVGVSRGFRIDDAGVVSDVVVVKAELAPPPLAGGALLIDRPGTSPVGYMHFRSFTSSANDPLRLAVAEFANAGVTDLVVDLRYNGGGLVSVADYLLDLLGGQTAGGQESLRLRYNDKHRNEDGIGYFDARPDTLQPLRIAFITTDATASASELVINSLSPHIAVALVGEDTRGKAVGQSAFDQSGCDTRLRLISFEVVNGEGFGGYWNGLFATGRFTLCQAEDDVTRTFGDPLEASLAEALTWLGAGNCSAAAATKTSALGARSDWQIHALPVIPDLRHPTMQ
jgi:carboxyl-terminal processing protease